MVSGRARILPGELDIGEEISINLVYVTAYFSVYNKPKIILKSTAYT